jgi:hypothetical protein
LDLPAQVAKAFVEDVRANLAEKNTMKRQEIARRQANALR